MHNFYCYRTSSLKAKSPLFSCLCASAKLYWQFDRNALYCNHKSPWRLCWPSCLLEGLERPKNGAKSATPGTQLRSLACFWNLNSESLSVSGFLSRHLLVCPQRHSQDRKCLYLLKWLKNSTLLLLLARLLQARASINDCCDFRQLQSILEHHHQR